MCDREGPTNTSIQELERGPEGREKKLSLDCVGVAKLSVAPQWGSQGGPGCLWPSEVEATYTLRGLDVLSQKAGVGPVAES